MRTLILIPILALVLTSCLESTPSTECMEVDCKRIIMKEMIKSNPDYRIFDLKLLYMKDSEKWKGTFVDINGDEYRCVVTMEGEVIDCKWLLNHHYDSLTLNNGEIYVDGKRIK